MTLPAPDYDDLDDESDEATEIAALTGVDRDTVHAVLHAFAALRGAA